jgi:UDP-N-acetylmuramate: L-alanyl-gamma-D-glutamyl-meso-diaminopimelate ligase
LPFWNCIPQAKLPAGKVYAGFGKNWLKVLNNKQDLMQWLTEQSYKNACLLLMSPGNYDGADILTFAHDIVK